MYLDDGTKLFRDYGILAKGLVELGALALSADPEGAKDKRKIVSLSKACISPFRHFQSTLTTSVSQLTAHYCQKTLSKGPVRVANWEGELGTTQLECTTSSYHLYPDTTYTAHKMLATTSIVL